jgi:hypothetical protein
MREAAVEGYLLACVAALDGMCLKLSAMGAVGWPDRLVLLPGGVAGFLELKRPGKAPTAMQMHRLDRLRALGYEADYADTHAKVRAFLDRLTGFAARTAAINQLADRLAT